jgi:hypothetical protein
MKIIYNGNILDHEKEWELNWWDVNWCDEEPNFGFIILAKNNESFWQMQTMTATAMTMATEIEEYTMYCNITEIHNKFFSMHGRQSNQIAFESDIFNTGSTPNLQQFEEIYIYKADKKYDSYYGHEKEIKQFIRELKLKRILK